MTHGGFFVGVAAFIGCALALTTNTMVATMMPPFRASSSAAPTLRVFIRGLSAPTDAKITVSIANGGPILITSSFLANPTAPSTWSVPLSYVPRGEHIIDVRVELGGAATMTEAASIPYHVVPPPKAGANSTGLIDGAFLDLLHWSEDESVMYNNQLRKMTAKDWRDQIEYMSMVGIRTAVLQATFLDDNYVRHHNQTCSNYDGWSLFPSRSYPRQYPKFTDTADKLEAILSAADERGVSVYVGVGLFAWFDFTPESLCWHRRVLSELHATYGRHPSLVGWYVSEEMFGSFFHETPSFDYPGAVDDMVDFFRVLRSDVRSLDPTYQLALAPNSQHFDQYAAEWERVLVNVDLLLPFGFARDTSFATLPAILGVCTKTNTAVWVDMELFAFPIGKQGLVPKPVADVIGEIQKLYPSVSNVVGYEFTGIMDHPSSRLHLGGAAAKKMYEDYRRYYEEHK